MKKIKIKIKNIIKKLIPKFILNLYYIKNNKVEYINADDIVVKKNYYLSKLTNVIEAEPIKIIDCFTFFNEIDLLKMRIELLYDHVDKFVISEANVTFSGKRKPYNFLERRNDFKQYLDKIEYLRYEPNIKNLNFTKPNKMDQSHAAWQIEIGQRDFLYSAVKDLDDDSLIIVSDVDEIWDPITMNILKNKMHIIKSVRLDMEFHYFYMNCKGVGPQNSRWNRAFCTLPSELKVNPSLGFSEIRTSNLKMPTIKKGGWHFSYLGGTESVINKIKSFSHQELNTEEIIEFDRINRCINLGLDPFNRENYVWAFFPVEAYSSQLASIMHKNIKFIKTNLI